MKKYYVIILCLLFIAGITSYATGRDKESALSFAEDSVAVIGAADLKMPDIGI